MACGVPTRGPFPATCGVRTVVSMFTDEHWPGATRTQTWATLADLWETARQRLPDDVWDFLVGGSGDETTLRENCSAFSGWRLRPRVMGGHAPPDLRTSFLGVDLAHPVLTAPFGAEGLFHDEGHLAVARANAAAGVASIVPEASTWSLEEVADAAPEAARIFQLHPMGRPEHVLHAIRRAEAAGYTACASPATARPPAGGSATCATGSRSGRTRSAATTRWVDRSPTRTCSASCSDVTTGCGAGTSSQRSARRRACRGWRRASSRPRTHVRRSPPAPPP